MRTVQYAVILNMILIVNVDFMKNYIVPNNIDDNAIETIHNR